jgi:hypothetical protein
MLPAEKPYGESRGSPWCGQRRCWQTRIFADRFTNYGSGAIPNGFDYSSSTRMPSCGGSTAREAWSFFVWQQGRTQNVVNNDPFDRPEVCRTCSTRTRAIRIWSSCRTGLIRDGDAGCGTYRLDAGCKVGTREAGLTQQRVAWRSRALRRAHAQSAPRRLRHAPSIARRESPA